MSETEKDSSVVRVSELPGGARCFQVRPIGTRDVELKSVVSAHDAMALRGEVGKVFILHTYSISKREDGKFDLDIRFAPGNGMAVVHEHNPIVNTAGDRFGVVSDADVLDGYSKTNWYFTDDKGNRVTPDQVAAWELKMRQSRDEDTNENT